MNAKQNRIDRRTFLRSVGAAGVGSVFASASLQAGPNEPGAVKSERKKTLLQVPRRTLGKLTQLNKEGKKVPLEVPVLSLGTMFDVVENQAALRESLKRGVNYWDTAYSYNGGNSELGIGKFLSRNPQMRRRLFIVSKASRAKSIDEVEQRLQESLKRMNTTYIDLYYGVHILSKPAQLTDELRQWAESAKKRKLIRYFGFSTHSNMAECLQAAAKVDWIDGILVLYNWRVMQEAQMDAAIEACYKKGIGLTAMKTQGRGQDKEIETEGDKKLTEHFLKRGFTAGQAKIKAVLSDKRISSACVGRGNVRELRENVAAVLDKTELTAEDMNVFRRVAGQTCTGYCAGCSNICGAALPDMPYVSEVMRCLMYHDSYGEKDTARRVFAELPREVSAALTSTDYTGAESLCPQHMPIGKLMARAATTLS